MLYLPQCRNVGDTAVIQRWLESTWIELHSTQRYVLCSHDVEAPHQRSWRLFHRIPSRNPSATIFPSSSFTNHFCMVSGEFGRREGVATNEAFGEIPETRSMPSIRLIQGFFFGEELRARNQLIVSVVSRLRSHTRPRAPWAGAAGVR